MEGTHVLLEDGKVFLLLRSCVRLDRSFLTALSRRLNSVAATQKARKFMGQGAAGVGIPPHWFAINLSPYIPAMRTSPPPTLYQTTRLN